MKFYSLKLCGLKRQLPIVKIGPKLSIASFNLLGDTILAQKTAKALVRKIKDLDFDIMVGPEVKVLPLVYQMAMLLGHKRYVIARKKIMGYMVNPVKLEAGRSLVLTGFAAQSLKGKRALIVDDVISTGRTIDTMKQLLLKVGCQPIAIAVALKQGELKEKIDLPLIYLGKLPLISPSSRCIFNST